MVDHDVRDVKGGWSEQRKKKELERNKLHRRWNRELETVAGNERIFWLKPNFEAELGLPKEESTKIDKALSLFAEATEEDIPECLRGPVEKLMEDFA